MSRKDDKRLRVGVLGCGPIAQAAHFDSCAKARNAELYAICDVAYDLRERMAATWAPEKSYADYAEMLADPALDAVVIATSDGFHVKAAAMALEAGKHVLCEKPLGVSVEEVESLRPMVARSGKILQVGHMKRFDAGIEAAKAFIDDEMGQRLALQGLVLRQHPPLRHDRRGAAAHRHQRQRPQACENPKADLRRYYMLAHGSHLLDTARHLFGPIEAVDARLTERFGACCWFVTANFADGTVGHLDLTVAVRMDWHEGFQIYGENGSVLAKTWNPWYYKSSDVDIFREADASWHRLLGADGHFYRRQLEGMADVDPRRRADGRRRPRGRHSLGARHGGDRALGRERPPRRPRRREGPSDAARHLRQNLRHDGRAADAASRGRRGLRHGAVQPRLPRPPLHARRDPSRRRRGDRRRRRRTGVRIAAVSGTYNMIHPDPAVRAAACAGSRSSPPPAARWDAARHALHRHPRPRGPVALAPGQRAPASLARPARRDGQGGRHRRALRHRRSASSPSSPTSSPTPPPPGGSSTRWRARGCASSSTPPTSSSRRTPPSAAAWWRRPPTPSATPSPWPTPRTAPPTAASPPPAQGVIDFAHFIALPQAPPASTARSSPTASRPPRRRTWRASSRAPPCA